MIPKHLTFAAETTLVQSQMPSLASIRSRYVELAQAAHQDLEVQYLGSTYSDFYAIVALYPEIGPKLDRGVLAEALIQGDPPERACALIAQSPYVQSQLYSHHQDVHVMSAYGMPLIHTYAQVYRSHHGHVA